MHFLKHLVLVLHCVFLNKKFLAKLSTDDSDDKWSILCSYLCQVVLQNGSSKERFAGITCQGAIVEPSCLLTTDLTLFAKLDFFIRAAL